MAGLKGRVALLVGTDTAAVHAIARALVASGARAYLVVPHLDGFGDLVARVGHNHLDAAALDPADGLAVARAIRACTRRFGRIDVILAIATTPGDSLPALPGDQGALPPVLVLTAGDARPAGTPGSYDATVMVADEVDEATVANVVERAAAMISREP